MRFQSDEDVSLCFKACFWSFFSPYLNVKTRATLTFEGLIQLALAEHHAEVVDGAGVELHPEHHVSGWVPEPLVVALQLRYQRDPRVT